MKYNRLNALIVDDHPAMVNVYEGILREFNFNIMKAYNCETAYKFITANTSHNQKLNLVLLDRSMPSFKAENINSGEDLALLVRKYHPKSKIIVLTSHAESFIIYTIFEKINPEGLLIKSDFETEELSSIFNHILKGDTYYSTSVKDSIKKVIKNKVFLDPYNRDIVSLVAKGIRNKNLSHHLPLSSRAIDTRKAEIKDLLGVSDGSDEDLIIKAKELGLV